MGRRSKTESIARVLCALLDQRTWRQAELARHVGVSSSTVGAILRDLRSGGIPLECESEHPHNYWSVPKSWFPNAVVIEGKDAAELIRLLLRLEQSSARDEFVRTLMTSAGVQAKPSVSVGPTPVDDSVLRALEDAIGGERAVEIRYAGGESRSWRHITPAHIELRPRPRMIAYCHDSCAAKWYRLEKVERVQSSKRAAVLLSPGEIAAFKRDSVDGYRDPSHDGELTFEVVGSDAAWVQSNLPSGVRFKKVSDGILVSASAAGREPLARLAVGLGASVRSMSPALAERVAALARGALEQIERARAAELQTIEPKLNRRSARAIRGPK